MLPLIREAIVILRGHKDIRPKKRPSRKRSPRSGGMDRQDFPYRVFPEGEDMLPGKSEVVGMFFSEKPPFAVLLYGEGGGYEAITRKGIFPVVYTEDRFKFGEGYQGMQYKSVFHSFRVKRKFSMKNGTNLQKSKKFARTEGKVAI
jgi:hypothetical protein